MCRSVEGGDAGSNGLPTDDPPRAEEIIAAVYAQLSALREKGRRPSAIVMPPGLYRIVQGYRALLGDVPDGLPDYLGKYDLFGVPIYTDGGEKIVIRTNRSPE
jgi:hypothetical protein